MTRIEFLNKYNSSKGKISTVNMYVQELKNDLPNLLSDELNLLSESEELELQEALDKFGSL